MPKSPKKPCRYGNCPKLTDGYYCAEHQKLVDSNYNKYQRDPDTYKRYGREWRKIRDKYISMHPLCEQCKLNGRLTPAREVHHILPLSRGGSNSHSNLMSLCKICHSQISARDGERWGER